jgi:hypothetical protein
MEARVMVFKSNLNDVRDDAASMLRAQAVRRTSPTSDWLFLGIPTFREWVDHRQTDDAGAWQAFALRADAETDYFTDLPAAVWK